MNRYIIGLLVGISLWCASAATINFSVDPFWFREPGPVVFDGRRQHLNALVRSQYPCQFDGVLFGSSRLKGLGQTLEPLGVYNFSFDDARPSEYLNYVETYTRVCGHAPKKFFVGLDFYSSSKHPHPAAVYPDFHSHLEDADRPWSFYLTVDAVLRSWNTKSPARTETYISDIWSFENRSYYNEVYERYEVDSEFENYVASWKRVAPEAQFIGFITPVSKPLFEFLQEKGLEDEYHAFVKVVSQSFHEGYNFMGLNHITTTPENFSDENHLHDEKAQEFLCALFQKECDQPVEAFRLSSSEVEQLPRP